MGWGRRCGLRAVDQARQPASMAKGVSPRSGAAPADVPRTHVSGRPRVTVRPNYVGLPARAGRGPDERGRKPAGSGGAMLPVRPRKHGPEAQNRRQWSAERRARLRRTRTAPRKRGCLWTRLPALHSPRMAKGETCPRESGVKVRAHPAPFSNNTGGGALAYENQIKMSCPRRRASSQHRTCRRSPSSISRAEFT
jgi:hypothetical protein